MSNVTNPHSVLLEDSSTGKPVAQKSTGGAAHFYLKQTDIPFPESWSGDYTLSPVNGTPAQTGTITSYSKATFVISGLTAQTVSVTGFIGSAQTLETAAIRPIDLNTGALATASTLGNGSYTIANLCVHKLKFTVSGAETPTVTLTLKA